MGIISYFKKLFNLDDSKEFTCELDPTDNKYYCYELDRGARVMVGGPYNTLEECQESINERMS